MPLLRHRRAIYDARFSTLQCGSWIDAAQRGVDGLHPGQVSVPFNAGRGLMPLRPGPTIPRSHVSVPFNAGRGLMPLRPGPTGM